jgi:hypothetical protein
MSILLGGCLWFENIRGSACQGECSTPCASSLVIYRAGTYSPHWDSGSFGACMAGGDAQPPTVTLDGEAVLRADLSCGEFGGVTFANWIGPSDAVPAGAFQSLSFKLQVSSVSILYGGR